MLHCLIVQCFTMILNTLAQCFLVNYCELLYRIVKCLPGKCWVKLYRSVQCLLVNCLDQLYRSAQWLYANCWGRLYRSAQWLYANFCHFCCCIAFVKRSKETWDEVIPLQIIKRDQKHRQEAEIKELTKMIQNIQDEKIVLQKALTEVSAQNKALQKEKRNIESEKNDALTRLSQLMSAKLIDNNPNIVNLSDQFRPTKLAEMFSELYDNEWTDAYGALEKEHVHKKDIIQWLLDIVMESYAFCESEMDRAWKEACEWFYDKEWNDEQTVAKGLKDARRQKVQVKAKDVEKRFVEAIKPIASFEVFLTFLDTKAVQDYISATILLCLYMTTTDPPVAIECHGLTSKHLGDGGNADGGSGQERLPFNRENFKEFTQRGAYLEYVVWPALLLHKEEPLLARGVAQGTDESPS